jgi:magnesium transporter
MIRGIAIGQVSQANAALLLRKEVAVGTLNGIIWSAVIGVYAGLLFGSASLGLVIGFAIVVNLVVAALSGATIPLLLRRYGADPALAGSVVLTTVTDVVGFFAFLGTATLFLI